MRLKMLITHLLNIHFTELKKKKNIKKKKINL